MSDFTAAELTGMRAAQTGHMMDTCTVDAYSETFNSFGEAVVTYTAGAAQDCGLDMRPGSERHDPNKTALEWDATIRLAITTAPNARDRITVTHRFGEALGTSLTFNVVGPIQRGPSGIRLLLKRVTT